jgi:hypothetical protein
MNPKGAKSLSSANGIDSMHYYNLVIWLLEALNTAADRDLPDGVVRKLLENARIRFETLVRLYYLRHGFETHSIFLVQLLSFLGFMHLRSLRDAPPSETDHWESGLVLAAKGIRDQVHNLYLAELVFLFLKSSMEPKSSHLLKYVDDIEYQPEKRKASIAEHVRSAWPVGIRGIDEDPEWRRLDNLVDATNELRYE